MAGLQKVLKMYGTIKCRDAKGKEVVWVWDYKNDKPMLKSEMSKEQWVESEKAKWEAYQKAKNSL